MATFTPVPISGAANGLAVKVVATATAGTTIHTAHATSTDGIWLWAYNSHTADVVLTLEWGGATAPDNNIVLTIPFKAGLVTVSPGLRLTGSLIVKAFASIANVVTLTGHVDRIT